MTFERITSEDDAFQAVGNLKRNQYVVIQCVKWLPHRFARRIKMTYRDVPLAVSVYVQDNQVRVERCETAPVPPVLPGPEVGAWDGFGIVAFADRHHREVYVRENL